MNTGMFTAAASQQQLMQADYMNAQMIYAQMQAQGMAGSPYMQHPGMMQYPGMMQFPGMMQQMPVDRNAQLVDGVKSGRINKDEFVHLANYRNETERLREKMGADGLSPQEQMYLRQRESAYDNMYQRYSYGDYHPRVNAKDNIHQRQLNQLGRIYNGLESGSLTRGEGRHLMGDQTQVSRNRGRMEADGRLGFFDKYFLNQQLNHTGFQIFNLKHNWLMDRGANKNPWPPQWFQPMPMGGMYGMYGM